MSRYSRRISGIERGYLNAATRGPHPTIHTMIDFEGRVPADCWRHASTIASAANPGTVSYTHLTLPTIYSV